MTTTRPNLDELLSHRDVVYSVARNICGGSAEAEEIALKTFAFACEWVPSAAPRPNLRTWLCGIAANHALMRVAALGPQPPPSQKKQNSSELAELLGRTLGQLDARVRTVFVLSDLASLTLEDVANILHASPREVRVQLHRARLAVREVLDGFFKRRIPGDALWFAATVPTPE